MRDYFPKGTDFTQITDQQVRHAQDQLNDRPRKTLNWLKPREKLGPLIVAPTA